MTTLAVQPPRYPVEQVPESSLHAVFRAAQRWASLHHREPIALHIGEPAYDIPPAAVEAMSRALRAGSCSYTSAEGMPQLREALVAKLAGQRIDADVDRVFVTPGSCQGLMAIGAAVHTPGAGWLIPQVHWPIYRQQGMLNGYRVTGYPLGPGYRLDVAAIARAATPDTRVIVVNSPANPTGAIADAETLRDLLALARERDWLVVADEAYEDFAYDAPHVSLAAFEADVDPYDRRVFSAFTFSKSYAMTGCRVGYVVAPNDMYAGLLRKVQEGAIIAPPTPSQIGALAALDAQDAVRANVAMVRRSRDEVMPGLVAAGIIDAPPAGGWYALLNIASSGLAAEAFAARLLAERGVAVAPAAAFALPGDPSTEHVIRISMAGDRAQLAAGVDAIVQACHEWGADRTPERLS
ncbi:pyridoxal phosphate-dependent aminotransferase [Dactylosporangium sp. NPDC000555]|uniref:pyridoxal phosphate-dependent aminotransferase n=1 Tax=Dactylosporangium sp. NPDC000555 TaxID=3154260 RepID=UPI003332097E